MKRQLLTALFFIGVITQTQILHAQGDEVEKVRSLLIRVAQLMEEGDLEKLDKIYAPGRGVHIIEGAGVNHGWQDYRDNHLRPELAAFKKFKIRYYAIEPQVRENVAYSSFRYELSAELESGPIIVEGRGTAILEKLSGQWRIVHTHTSGRTKQ